MFCGGGRTGVCCLLFDCTGERTGSRLCADSFSAAKDSPFFLVKNVFLCLACAFDAPGAALCSEDFILLDRLTFFFWMRRRACLSDRVLISFLYCTQYRANI